MVRNRFHLRARDQGTHHFAALVKETLIRSRTGRRSRTLPVRASSGPLVDSGFLGLVRHMGVGHLGDGAYVVDDLDIRDLEL